MSGGVRTAAGWRIALVLAGSVLIWTLMIWVSTFIFGAEVTPLSRAVCALSVFGLVVAMIIAARRWLDCRSWPELRLQRGRKAWRPFLTGVAAFILPSPLSSREAGFV